MKKLILLIICICITGCAPKQGDRGLSGINGNNGSNGLSCTVIKVNTGALLTCPDSSSVLILNGSNNSKDNDSEHGDKK